VRFICGTMDIHRRLERTIADFYQREDAITYAACFDANAGLFEVGGGLYGLLGVKAVSGLGDGF